LSRKSAALRCLLACLLPLSVARCTSTSAPVLTSLPRGDGPSLVVIIAVDQLRYDYLVRFRSLLNGGLAHLLDSGAVFTDAHQNHSMTATAPGHATLSTGLEPARSGIVGNNWYDRQQNVEVYSGGPAAGRSPALLQGTAIGDWMKVADPRSKVFTASIKDRAAIMLGGHGADGAFWYDGSYGSWTSSSYYGRSLPDWLVAFNREERLDRFYGTAWEPLTDESRWSEVDVEHLDTGAFARGFPHVLGSSNPTPSTVFYQRIPNSPWGDWYLAELAEALILNEDLGADGSVDFLGLSFSSLDWVGHAYGPNAPEVLDILVRLDRRLAELLEFIDERVGLDHVLLALSADHGVQVMPEYVAPRGLAGKRLDGADLLCIQQAGERLREKLGDHEWIESGYYLDESVIAQQQLDKADVEAELAAILGACSVVDRVWTSTELMAETPSLDLQTQRYRNNYFPGRSPDLIVQYHDYFLDDQSMGTTHGTVFDYDSHVPLIVAGPGVAARQHDERAATVDLAPTLAALLGIKAAAELDGRDLSAQLR
jgi:arylsulfatase A-like enzyme